MVSRAALLAEWSRDAQAALAVQRALAERVVTQDRFPTLRTVAGVDVSYDRASGRSRAAVAVLSFPGLDLVDSAVIEESTRFPYVPGLLSFREVPPVLAAMERLEIPPDLILCDGHGLAHPRRFGLACHLGLLLDIPTIGVAKSRLVGTYGEPGPERGDRSDLVHRSEVVGAVLRTRRRVSPVFVSVGHRVCLASAVRLVLATTPRWRLPETTRVADRLSKTGKN